MLEQPEEQQEQADPEQIQQQLDELERLQATADQASFRLEAAAPPRTFGRVVGRAANSLGHRIFPNRIGTPIPEYRPEEARRKLELYDAVDNMYAAALQASGYGLTTFTRLQAMAPDRIVERSREIAEPTNASRITYEPRAMLREARHWLTESRFVTEHHPAVESMTSERVTNLASKLNTIIQDDTFTYPVHTRTSNGDEQKCWISKRLAPYDAAPGESGGNVNISDDRDGYTLYYLDHPADGSEAKLGLWAHDKTSDKKIWIVAGRREGIWQYEGADLQTDLQLGHPTAVWNTVEPSVEDVDMFMSKIEDHVNNVYNDLREIMVHGVS